MQRYNQLISHSRNFVSAIKNSSALFQFFSNFSNKVAENENKIQNILVSTFPKAKSIEVKDISGGCGAMYEIYVQAPQFKGLSIVKQHKLITEALKEEIKEMHGLRIHTSPV